MGVWIKRILIGLVALIVLLVAVVVGALAVIDTEALKRIVSEQVEANTGRELTIEGELGISIFPWIGFELGSTRLANADGFDQRPFVALERAELRVQVLPLLEREVAVDRIVLHGLSLNLARDADGRGNWEDLVPEEGEARAAEPDARTGAAEPAKGPGISLRVEGVEVRDANLAWRDASSGQDLFVRDLNIETGALAPNEPTPVGLSVTLEPTDAPRVSVKLQTEATFDPAVPRVRLADLRVDLDASGDALPGGGLSARIAADVDADLAAGRIGVANLRVGLADTLEARGELTATTAGDTPTMEGRLALTTFNPRDLMETLEIALPEGLQKKALRTANAAFSFSAAGESVQVEDLTFTLDDTRASGSLSAQAGAIPEAGLRLSVDRIELDRYMPPPTSGDSGTSTADGVAGEAADPVATLPLESMRGLRATAAVDVGRLEARGLDATNVKLRLRLDDGLLVLKKLSADVADGALALGARLDGRTDVPAADVDLRLDGIQSRPLLAAVMESAPISGRLDATIGLETSGSTLDDWIAALNGRLVTTFSDGAVEGINIAQRIRVGQAKLEGKSVDAAERTRRTDFSRLHFAAGVRKGVVHSDELDLRAPLLRVGGEGKVDLVRQSVDYVARVLVTGTLEGQGGLGGEQLKGLEIPLRIHGPLAAPKFELAFADALEARAKAKKEALEREAKEAAEKAERELEEAAAREKAELREKRRKKERELEKKLEQKKAEEKEEIERKLEEELEGLFD